MARPANQARWAETGGGVPSAEIAEPASGKKDTGWLDGEMPPHNWFNWWMWQVFQWIKWIAAKVPGIDESQTWTAVQHLNGAGGADDAAWDKTEPVFGSYRLIYRDSAPGPSVLRHYMGLVSSIWTWNAKWDEGTARWIPDWAAAGSTRLDVSFDGGGGENGQIYTYRVAAGAAPFVDGAWASVAPIAKNVALLQFDNGAVAGGAGGDGAHLLAQGANTKYNNFTNGRKQTLGQITNDGVGKITFTRAGKYRVFGSVSVENISAPAVGTVELRAILFVNGAGYVYFGDGTSPNLNGKGPCAAGETIIQAAVNDFVELYYFVAVTGDASDILMRQAQLVAEFIGP